MADNTNPYGVDLAIDPNSGDLVHWPNGALGVTEGPANAVQAMLLWIKTMPYEVPLHPDFGSVFNQSLVGGKLNIVGLEGLARAEFKNILAQDSRFLTVRGLSVAQIDGKWGPQIHVNAILYLAGGETVEVLDFSQGVFATVQDADTLDPSPVDPLDDPSFFVDDAEADDLNDPDVVASAVEDLDSGVIDPPDL